MCNCDINAMMNFKPDECTRLMFLSDDTDKGNSEEKSVLADGSRTYDPLVTCPDALPLSYRRFVGAKATKLDSCDKHPAYF